MSMDFFTAANDNAALSLTANDSFAQAIATGFSSFSAQLPPSIPPPMVTRMSTVRPLGSKPVSTATAAATDFTAVHPLELAGLVAATGVLLIDIRPHAAFTNARLPNALSLSVPSTLLKRPLFSLEKLAAMLSSPASRSRFMKWNQSVQIIVYDADSASLPDSSNILGLLKKFNNERPAYEGKLCWLQGGFQGVWRECKDIIDQNPVVLDNSSAPATALQTSLLPPSAFRAPRRSSPAPGSLRPSMSMQQQQQPFNPFFDTVRQNVELSHGITERIPLKLPPRVKQRINDLPFQWLRDIAARSTSAQESDVDESMEALAMQFYRIELAEQRRLMGVMEHHSRESQLSVHSDTPAPVKPFPFSITAGVEKGSKNRYRHIWPFEHARVRLQSTSKPADVPSQPHAHRAPISSRPMSLTLPPSTSGPSKPFAMSIPLKASSSSSRDEDDYVNASYVQPLCTRRRYIATQGPLDATFNDFWTLVWQQNVHVIVMLTREIEGATIKCGCYWKEGTYGPLSLKMISCEGQQDSGDTLNNKSLSGGFFNFDNEAQPAQKESPMIKRVFTLTHLGLPHSKPRQIVHFQYLDWPDMNVPDDPRGLLGLIKEVAETLDASQARQNIDSPPLSPPPSHGPLEAEDFEMEPLTGVAQHQRKGTQPLLLHCSAGVGRTGGYIAVDAILDGIRHEVRKQSQLESPEFAMSSDKDVDGDVVMGNDVRTASMPPNMEGDVLHVPLVSVSPSPMVENQSLNLRQSATQQWAEHVNRSTDSEGRSSLDTSSSSDESSFGFPPSGRRKSVTKDADGEVSPYGAGSGYSTTASSLISFEGMNGGEIQPPKTRPFNLSLGAGGGVKGLLGQRLEMPRPRTFSAPDSIEGSPGPPPSSSRSLSPFVRDTTAEPSSPPSVGSPPSDAALASAPAAPMSSPSKAESSTATNSVSTSTLTNVDYKDPRPMHTNSSPPLLSSYEEPMCEIVQDMREQRMSLCQSLRQYVFVHAAVIEGALMVADEEGATRRRVPKLNTWTSSGPFSSFNDTASVSSSQKRGASPTELLKEDVKGEVRMSKRPSVKRKQRSGGSDAQVHAYPTPTVKTSGSLEMLRRSFEIS